MLVMLRIPGQASDLPARLVPGPDLPLTRPGHDFPVDAGILPFHASGLADEQCCLLLVVLRRQIFTTAKAEVVRRLE
jgi:hypothetical protein